PQVLVVPRGGKVDFPNLDPSFHNVFSLTPGSTFDLGSYHQGDSRSVTMTKPGVISVYCNVHSAMYGHILVVPNSLYVKAGADGSYRIANVPAGRHKIVAWTPFAMPSTQDVDVADGETANAELSLVKGKRTPHLNKEGLPYGSYKE